VKRRAIAAKAPPPETSDKWGIRVKKAQPPHADRGNRSGNYL